MQSPLKVENTLYLTVTLKWLATGANRAPYSTFYILIIYIVWFVVHLYAELTGITYRFGK